MARSSMKKDSLKCAAVTTSPDAEDAVSEWLTSVTGIPAVTYHDRESGDSTVTIHFESGSLEVPTRAEIRKQLKLIESFGLSVAPAAISIRSVRREDWAESWKRHFPALDVGPFLVKPSWNRRLPKAGQHPIVLDPGLSFGTGHHATTRFCLEQIAACRSRWKNPSMLDIGTGSGLLAIAAAMLDYRPVEAFDFDPDSVEATRENCAVNGVADRVKVRRQDLVKARLETRRPHDLVCANLIFDLLIREKEKISNRVAEGGTLVLAGILETQFRKVRRAFADLGWKLRASKVENEWKSGRFDRAG